jgi:hypothetical protein
VALGEYCREQPAMTLDPELGPWYSRPDTSDLANSAAIDLVSILGFALLGHFPSGGDPLYEPSTWEREGLRGELTETRFSDDGKQLLRVDFDVCWPK